VLATACTRKSLISPASSPSSPLLSALRSRGPRIVSRIDTLGSPLLCSVHAGVVCPQSTEKLLSCPLGGEPTASCHPAPWTAPAGSPREGARRLVHVLGARMLLQRVPATVSRAARRVSFSDPMVASTAVGS